MMSWKVGVLLQELLDLDGDTVVLLADDRGIESVGGRRERVDSREQAERRNTTRKNRGGIEVRKRRGRRRVGQVVCGDVDSLDGGNGARLGRGNALLEVAHLGCQRGLVTNGGRHTAQQCGNLGTCLGEAEDVVNEQQDVLATITEILSGGKAGQTDAQTRSRAARSSDHRPSRSCR